MINNNNSEYVKELFIILIIIIASNNFDLDKLPPNYKYQTKYIYIIIKIQLTVFYLIVFFNP